MPQSEFELKSSNELLSLKKYLKISLSNKKYLHMSFLMQSIAEVIVELKVLLIDKQN
jgi:hypothetical protein